MCTCLERWSGIDYRPYGAARRSIEGVLDANGNFTADMELGNVILDGSFTSEMAVFGNATTALSRSARAINYYPNQHIPVQHPSTTAEFRTSCSKCATGWVGVDCSVATTKILADAVPSAVVFSNGHFQTFDGAAFDYRGKGEYTAFFNPQLDMEMQVRQVLCNLGRSVCTSAVAFRVQERSVVIHAPYETGQPVVVWINGQEVALGASGQLDTVEMGYSFFVQRSSRGTYRVWRSDGFALQVRVAERSLGAQLQVPRAACAGAYGLLGTCDGSPLNDFKLGAVSSASILQSSTAVPASLQLSQINIHNLYAPAWATPLQRSLFLVTYNYHGNAEQRQSFSSGFALFFNNTGATSRPLFSFADTTLTLQFMVKPLARGGTLLSYATYYTLAVVDEVSCDIPNVFPCPVESQSSTVHVRFGSSDFDTLAQLQIGVWNEISLVWRRSTDGSTLSGLLEFYHLVPTSTVDADGVAVPSVTAMSMVLGSSPFLPGGILSLGQWALSPSGLGTIPRYSYIGLIDEVRFWSMLMDEDQLRALYGRFVDPSTASNLAGFYTFDQGQGEAVADAMSRLTCGNVDHDGPCIYLPNRKLYAAPEWRYSDVQLFKPASAVADLYQTTFLSVSVRDDATTVCNGLFLGGRPIIALCSGLGMAMQQYYAVACTYDASVANHVYAGIASLDLFADMCDSVLAEITSWPARRECNAFDTTAVVFPDWFGASCDSPCVFGQPQLVQGQYLCICETGYWGSSCSQICPGGSQNPCSNHGTCAPSTGLCLCDSAWQGDSQCSSCTENWTGANCDQAVSVLPPVFYPGFSVFGEGFVTTFFGQSFQLEGWGNFLFTASEVSTVLDSPVVSRRAVNDTLPSSFIFKLVGQAIPCGADSTKSCLNSVRMEFGPDNVLVIAAPQISRGPVVITMNGEPITPSPNFAILGGLLTLSQAGAGFYRVTGPDFFVMEVTIVGRLITYLRGKVSRDFCDSSEGLAGNCISSNPLQVTQFFTGAMRECSIFGQGDISPFASAPYSFAGQCTYTLVQNSELTLDLDARVHMSPCLDSSIPLMCPFSATIEVPAKRFDFTSDGNVLVNDMPVLSFPYSVNHAHEIVQTADGVQLHCSSATFWWTGTSGCKQSGCASPMSCLSTTRPACAAPAAWPSLATRWRCGTLPGAGCRWAAACSPTACRCALTRPPHRRHLCAQPR